MKNGRVSFWIDQAGIETTRPELLGVHRCDVCIIGAGFTGLWTAYYLKKDRPHLKICVVEARFAGFGASGRNGGWLTNAIAGSHERYAKTHGTAAAKMLQAAYSESVDEVINVAKVEGINADIIKGGNLVFAYSPAQLKRIVPTVDSARAWGLDDWEILDEQQSRERINAHGVLGGYLNPQCARINPAKLVRGLSNVVENMGVEIYEDSRVTDFDTGRVRTERGEVHADYIVRATEGFTASLPGLRRSWLPMNSSMIVTEQISEAEWERIGWDHFETLGDMAHAYTYAQRTSDGRIAIGGRGIPYRFGSKTDVDGVTQDWTVEQLIRQLENYFPYLKGVQIAHAWAGVLGVPRDWCATVTLDPKSKIAWAGGFVGHGVTTANLAGRTLRDLILGQTTELTELPWVNRRVRAWEPEPIRWLGVRSMYLAYRSADALESRGRGRTSVIARIADRVSGRY